MSQSAFYNNFVLSGLDYCEKTTAIWTRRRPPAKIHFRCQFHLPRDVLHGGVGTGGQATLELGSPASCVQRDTPFWSRSTVNSRNIDFLSARTQEPSCLSKRLPRSAIWREKLPRRKRSLPWAAVRRPSSGSRPKAACSCAIGLNLLCDRKAPWLELGLWAGWEMYPEWGGAPGAGVVCGIGVIEGRRTW